MRSGQESVDDQENCQRQQDLQKGDYIVYPAHGVGRVTGVEKETVAGFDIEVYVVSFEQDKMTLRVPTAKAIASGMRPLANDKVLADALKTLRGKAKVKRTMCGAAAPRIRSQDQFRRPHLDCRGCARSAPP